MTKPRKPTRGELAVARDMLRKALRAQNKELSHSTIVTVARKYVYPKYRRKIQTEARRRTREMLKLANDPKIWNDVML